MKNALLPTRPVWDGRILPANAIRVNFSLFTREPGGARVEDRPLSDSAAETVQRPIVCRRYSLSLRERATMFDATMYESRIVSTNPTILSCRAVPPRGSYPVQPFHEAALPLEGCGLRRKLTIQKVTAEVQQRERPIGSKLG